MSHFRHPLYFGAPDARVFGFLQVPSASPARRVGVVICDSLGYETVSLRRTLRHLADRLAGAGFASLRYDNHGTGDSSGSDRDPERVRTWLDGVRAARDELVARTGVRDVVFIGVRIGATLAATAVAEADPAAGMVLWAPCTRGRTYVRERQALANMRSAEFPDTRRPDVIGDPADVNAGGYVLTVETASDLSKLDLTRLARLPARDVLILQRSSEGALVARLRELGAEVSVESSLGYDEMMAEPHQTTVPDAALDSIGKWLDEKFPERDHELVGQARTRAVLPIEAHLGAPHRDAPSTTTSIEEEPIAFGPEDRLFGVVARPRVVASKERPAVILLNAGAVHHISVNRMSVSLARSLAAAGFLSLRLDLGGIGDSWVEPGTPENVSYSTYAKSEIRAAIDAVRARHGVERFVLAGLCSGGHYAFHGAIEGAPVVSAVMINPLFYLVDPEATGHDEYKSAGAARHYRRAILRPEAWLKLARGGVNIARVARLARERLETKMRARFRHAIASVGLREKPQKGVAADLRRIAANGVDALLVLCEAEPSLAYLRTHGGGIVEELRGKGLRLEVVPETDHTFTPLWSQNVLHDLVTRHLTERFGR